jgi:ribonucleoside-diphosphate reductase alpha chain
MQLATDNTNRPAVSAHDFSSGLSPREPQYSQYKIIRRNGSVAGFEPDKISIAMTKAFIAVNGGPGVASSRVREVVARLTDDVVNALMRRQPAGGTFHIEDIQD